MFEPHSQQNHANKEAEEDKHECGRDILVRVVGHFLACYGIFGCFYPYQKSEHGSHIAHNDYCQEAPAVFDPTLDPILLNI